MPFIANFCLMSRLCDGAFFACAVGGLRLCVVEFFVLPSMFVLRLGSSHCI